MHQSCIIDDAYHDLILNPKHRACACSASAEAHGQVTRNDHMARETEAEGRILTADGTKGDTWVTHVSSLLHNAAYALTQALQPTAYIWSKGTPMPKPLYANSIGSMMFV